MELKQIECFVAVVQKKSFSKAAEMLFMSQPAVTSNVQRLESELGLTLINRKNKEISLTEGGKLFYRYAAEMLNICAKAEHSLNEYKKKMEGILEICASTIPEQYLLPSVIKSFKEKYPLVVFSVYHKDSKAATEEIVSGRFNIGFVGAKFPSVALEYIDFYEDKLVLIASPTKSFKKDPPDLKSLKGEDIVLREEGSGTRLLLEKALKEKELDLSFFRFSVTSDSLEAIKKMVEFGVGISFVPAVAVKEEIALGRLKQYEIRDLNLTRHFSLVYCSNRCLSPLEEKFKDYVANLRGEIE